MKNDLFHRISSNIIFKFYIVTGTKNNFPTPPAYYKYLVDEIYVIIIFFMEYVQVTFRLLL